MGNDISISVKVDDDSGPGLAAVNNSLRTLKQRATDAGQALRTLATRGTTAGTSLGSMEDKAQGAERALRRLKEAAENVRVRAGVDDDTQDGVDAVRSAVDRLKALGPVRIATTVDSDTRQITASTTALRNLRTEASRTSTTLTRLQTTAGDVRIEARLRDETGRGITSVRTALRALKAESPIRLSATFDGDPAAIRTAATAMRDLRTNSQQALASLTALAARSTTGAAALDALKNAAQDAGNALRTLRGRAAAAAASLADLRDRAVAAAAALRTLNTRTATADTRLGELSTRTRTLRTDMDDLDGSLTRVGGSLGGLRGSLGTLSTGAAGASGSMRQLLAVAIMLSPAVLPIAASLVPLAGALSAAAVGVAAFGIAVAPQAKAMLDAAKASSAYDAAVRKNGMGSKQASVAAAAWAESLAELPPATAEAAAALSVLGDEYKDWSKALAGDTMPVATKMFAIFGGVMQKMTPVVKSSSAELNRMMTVLAGGVQSRGFEQFMDKLAAFAAGALQDATTGLLRFGQALQSGKGSSDLHEFLQYAKDNGPLVGETLKNLAQALVHLLAGASDVGVSMLTLVNALAGLVNSVPTGVITAMLQLALAIKAVQLAVAGGAAISAGLAAVRVQLALAGTAAIGTTGALSTLRVAFMAMSVAARVAIASTGIGLLIVALMELSSMGQTTPPNIDKLTGSLTKFGKTGAVTGEAASAFGSHFEKLREQMNKVIDPSLAESFNNWGSGLSGGMLSAGYATEDLGKSLDAIDKSLANMVSGGKADLAKAALERMLKTMDPEQAKKLTESLGDYRQALADAAFEQKLAAEAQGLFGDQAYKTKTKLDEQKASADGLRGAIQALNDVNRSALGGMIGFEAAIDAAAKAAQENAGKLKMVGGVLDLNSEGAQKAAGALSDLAAKTDEAAGAARDSGKSWATVNGIYERGRATLIATAMQMGLTRDQARALANQILKTPDKTAKLKGNLEDLKAKLADAKGRLARAPSSKTAKIKGEISDLQRKIARAKADLASVHSKTVSVGVRYYAFGDLSLSGLSAGRMATGGVVGAAGGGPRSRMTLVGEQGPELVDLAPGSRVRSNPDTKRALAGGHAGGGSSSQPMVVNLQLDGRTLARVLIDPLRGEISNMNGGNVQAALGKGR